MAAVFAVVSSSSAVAGLEPDATVDQPVANQNVVASSTPRVIDAVEARVEIPDTIATNECNPADPATCIDPPSEPVAPLDPATSPDEKSACATGGDHSPVGRLTTVPSSANDPDALNVVRFQVQVEEGLAIDGECFAETALSILVDEQGWTTAENVNFALVDDDSHHFTLVLASPGTTDLLCRPLNTGGRYSCRNGRRVVINVMRWESGTDDYTDNLTTYRTYLLNHEVGHFLGKGHRSCPAQGALAPVMMQQTKGLKGCLPNGWPTEGER